MSIDEFQIPIGKHAPAKARRLLDEVTGDHSRDLQFAARLCLTELVCNCMRYAGLPEGTELRFRTELDNERLRVEVAHDGPGFVARVRPPSEREESGWGLALVEALSSSWGASPYEGLVWFEIRVAAEVRPGVDTRPQTRHAH
jgi:two-component sensor histidine kinase